MPSVSKSHLRNKELVAQVANEYRTTMKQVEEIARQYGVNHLTARVMIRTLLSDEQFKQLKKLRYRRSKQGENNPMYGKYLRVSDLKHCSDCKGYLTRLVGKKRYFLHHIVVANALGMTPENLPAWLVIHHIDGDPLNNELDNLVITTKPGHRRIHERYQQSPRDLVLKKSTLQECIRFMTST